MDTMNAQEESNSVAKKSKTVNGHKRKKTRASQEITNGETEETPVNGEVTDIPKSTDENEENHTNGKSCEDEEEGAKEEESPKTEAEDENPKSKKKAKNSDKKKRKKKNDDDTVDEEEKENCQNEGSSKEEKSEKTADEDVQIVKDDESDLETADEEKTESKDKEKEKEEKNSAIIILEAAEASAKAAAERAASSTPKSSVSSSAQTGGTPNMAASIQTALQAIAGGGSAIQGLQNAYLNAIQSVLLAQGNSPQGTNQQYLSQLQQYYNTGTTQEEAYVIEAPSFIVPYVMEGKPKEAIPDFVTRIDKELKEYELEEKKNRDSKKAKKSKAKDTEKSKEPETDTEEDKEDKEEEDKEDKEEEDTEKKSDTKEDEEPIDKDDADYKVKENEEDDSSSSESDDDVIDLEKEEIKIDEDMTHLGRWEPYYRSTLGKFMLDLGLSQAQEFIQQDLYKMQKRKLDKMKTNPTKGDLAALRTLDHQLNTTRKKNSHLATEMKMCKFCSFKTESETVMSRHHESPHMTNYTYKCNFCEFETRGPQVILFHMEAEHNVRGRLERASAFFQCPLCPYEDNNKSKMTRHSFSCAKRFKPEKNAELPDWDPPAKIPKKGRGALSNRMDAKVPNLISKSFGSGMLPANLSGAIMSANAAARGRGRPVGSYKNISPAVGKANSRTTASLLQQLPGVTVAQQLSVASQVLQSVSQGGLNQLPLLLPVSCQAAGGFGASSSITIQSVHNKTGGTKSPQQPSISITPLPRGGASAKAAAAAAAKDGIKPSFVICEICDGYIKDLEQLRNHMNLIHHVKIHPKMIYNRPPLNCQKCQHRFFTDQGLERHLLGNHGLVTSSMQEASNKGKDAGRCPICGKVFQWKLLNHVSRDHKMTLKPAHLSYKCTVCTATFNMYRLFENHVYSAHSVVNKNKSASGESSSAKKVTDAPLKINDEITIIPQPSSKSKAETPKKEDSPSMSKEITITKVGSRTTKRPAEDGVEVINLDETPSKKSAESETPRRLSRSAKRAKLV